MTGTPCKWAAKIEKNYCKKQGKEGKEKASKKEGKKREEENGGGTGPGKGARADGGASAAQIKKALCGNRRPSNDCLPYEKS